MHLNQASLLSEELGARKGVEKWLELKPEIFLLKPLEFKYKKLFLYRQSRTKQVGFIQQPRET